MLFGTQRMLREADRHFAEGRPEDGFRTLRRLSVARLGRLLNDGVQGLPALEAALPVMPAQQVQRDWTGAAGLPLLRQTRAFVRSLERGYREHRGRSLEDATILDYGCGWGRILRLMLRFSDPSRLYGLDAWPASLEVYRASRMPGHVALCDEVPGDLPFAGVTFDLVYAFSVFTHLSEKTATAVLAAIRPRLSNTGLLVVTVRPPEYWRHATLEPGTDVDAMVRRHESEGYAFTPHRRVPVNGDVTYGDTSLSLEYVRRNWTEWRLVGTDSNRADPHQLILFLRPV